MRNVYMVHINEFSGHVFVKELEYFRSQGGFQDDWGLNWKPIIATSLERAKEQACQWPGALPYLLQAK